MNIKKAANTAISALTFIGLCWFGNSAHADISVVYTGPVTPVDQGGGHYLYTYNVNLIGGEVLNSGGDKTQSFFTLYDLGGMITNVINPTAFSSALSPTSVAPAGVNHIFTGVDSSLYPNLVFSYTGPNGNGGTPISAGFASVGTFSFESTVNVTTFGEFAGQAAASSTGNVQLENDGATILPLASPEPSTIAAFAFTGFGVLGLMLRTRKSRVSNLTA